MTGCESILTCRFLKDSDTAGGSVEKWKDRYCLNNYYACARYVVSKTVGGDFVPNDLQPDQEELGKELIEEAKEWL